MVDTKLNLVFSRNQKSNHAKAELGKFKKNRGSGYCLLIFTQIQCKVFQQKGVRFRRPGKKAIRDSIPTVMENINNFIFSMFSEFMQIF